MYSNQDVARLRQAVEQFDIAIPKAITEAEALHQAAAALLASVRSESAPNIDAINIKNLNATHEQIVVWPSHVQREEAAAKIESNTAARRLWAWEVAAGTFVETFRKPFNDAAALFVKSLNELGGAVNAELAIKSYQQDAHRTLMSSAVDLETLGTLRNVLAGAAPFDAGNHDVSVFGRVLTLPNMDAVIRIRSSNQRPFSLEWFARMLTIKGVEIEWHTPSEQQTYAALSGREQAA